MNGEFSAVEKFEHYYVSLLEQMIFQQLEDSTEDTEEDCDEETD